MPHLSSALGLTPDQARLYRHVLAASGTGLADLAKGLSMTPAELGRELAPLVAVGAVRIEGARLRVASPAEVVGQQLARWSEVLGAAGDQLTHLARAVPQLEPGTREGPTLEEESPIEGEVFVRGDVIGMLAGWIEGSGDDLRFLRPDQWRLPSESKMAVAVAAAIQQGREARAIYPARALREAPSVLIARAAIGEQVRVVPEVPTRLAIVGGRAVLPDPPGVGIERRVAVRQPGLVEMLTRYFDELWNRAIAVPALQHGDTRPDLHDLLLTQLARGAKDEQIARSLGISLRTVRRRVAALMVELGVDSRFQAGVEAVRRGWL
jgi:hypothetical protein